MTDPHRLDYATNTAQNRHETARRWAAYALRVSLFNAIILLSVGWLLPMVMGVTSLLAALREANLGAAGHDSFPHLPFAEQAFAVAFVWMAASVLTWSIVLLRHFWPARTQA